ncbi:MAG: alpha/beta hydrolase family protein [Maioricimonas sp. JB049]
MIRLLLSVCLLSLLSFGSTGFAADDNVAATQWNMETLHKPPAMRWLDESSPIRSLLFEGEPYRGQSTDVYAIYATPGTISGDPSKDHDLPAVVLVHGGGGTAFPQWVWQWAKRGYAAIAMDLSGRRSAAPEFDPETGELIVIRRTRQIPRSRLERGGPEQGHEEKFDSVGGSIEDDWPYHAVASVIRAHSLVRSFEEVDADRTAVTGISWGGYLTCIVASRDDRFKAAAPVYGCGFLYDGESVQRPLIERLPDGQRAEWIRRYDPSAHLPDCTVPILFVNGSNDVHYPLRSYMRSYELVPGEKQLRIEVGMRHSHEAGFVPEEIGLFFDQHLRGGTPLPTLSSPVVQGERVTVSCESGLPIKTAKLHYTTDEGILSERTWQSVDAAVDETGRIDAEIPAEATVCLIAVRDERNALVSSEVIFRNAGE